jgi:hypothetical protein
MATEVKLREYKNYVKQKSQALLLHEQGHYIIGCLCALEFERRCHQTKFTDNYKKEVPRLFFATLKEFSLIEKRYDKETNHRLDEQKQGHWDRFLAK